MGKVDVESNDGHRYFLNVVDECSRFIYVCSLRSKSKASESLLAFGCRFEKQSRHSDYAIHTNGGTEFTRALDRLDKNGVDVSIATLFTL